MAMNKLESIFEKFINKSSIFLNHEVLRHDFIPDELPHREEEIIKFGEILAPSLRGSKCSNL
ncbi:cell division control protein Cdc6, partial [Candidatus Bathyarchaeota archaeon]